MENINEIWKDIKGYEGIYQVSNLGRVRRIKGWETIGMYGQIIKRQSNGIIQGYKGKRQNDYWRVQLRKDGKTIKKTVHQLVYEAFVGEIPDGMQVNHIDENKDNNRLDNLNLMTPKENSNWGTRTDRIVSKNRGMKRSEEAKLNMSEAQKRREHKPIKPIIQYSKEGEFIKEWEGGSIASKLLNINQGHISQCCKGKLKTAGGYIWRYK